jgi:signal transduction histidine kinase
LTSAETFTRQSNTKPKAQVFSNKTLFTKADTKGSNFHNSNTPTGTFPTNFLKIGKILERVFSLETWNEKLGGRYFKMEKLQKKLSENNILKVPFLRNILFVSLVIITVLPLYVILFIYPSFNKLLTDDKRDDAIQIARHLSSILVSQETELTKNMLQAHLSDEVEQLRKIRDDFDLIKLKFFSKSGEVIFSSDPADTGNINNKNYFHEIVAKGKIYAEVIKKDTMSLEGQKMPADVVETYVPLMKDKEFLGAFEIYYDITVQKAELNSLLSRSSMVLFALAFALLSVIGITLFREKKNITERKNIQARLQEAQKMEAIATLAGGIAHEFNNALCVVIPNIDLLKTKLPDNEEINKYTQPIQSSAQRMAHLTSQLLAYARGGKYRPQQISLNNLVRDTLPFMKHLIKAGIVVETDLAEDSCYVEADRTQLQMVLLAAMVNAAEAIETEGYIRLNIGREQIDGEFAKGHPHLKPGSYVSLTIEDNGSGMCEETRIRVFEPFFTTKFQGRGLGMAAVYGIVKNHDGLVVVDSELGKGTVVRIYLPETDTGDVVRF